MDKTAWINLMSQTIRPGSHEARNRGCNCPIEDNRDSRHSTFICVAGCPLHSPGGYTQIPIELVYPELMSGRQ